LAWEEVLVSVLDAVVCCVAGKAPRAT